MIDDPISRIEAALEAGPTPGPWVAYTGGAGSVSSEARTVCVAPSARKERPVNAIDVTYIAACNPAAIRALLDRLKDIEQNGAQAVRWAPSSAHWSSELRRLFGADARDGIGALEQRLRDAEDTARKANAQAEHFKREWYLRGDEVERLRAFEAGVIALLPGVTYMDPPDGGDVQMDEQLRRMAKDAERYRHLRRKVAIVGAEFRVMNLPGPTFVAPIAAIEFDSAIDKEISARTDARPPTPIGWSDTDFIKHLEDQARHPLEGLHINRGSVDAAADAYEAEYNAARGIT